MTDIIKRSSIATVGWLLAAATTTSMVPSISLAAGVDNAIAPSNARTTVADRPLSGLLGSLTGQLRTPLGAHPASVAITMAMRNRDELGRLVAEQSQPGSPAFRQSISAANFSDRYAPLPADTQRIARYLREHGFTNVRTSTDRMLITADGTATTMQSAFATRLGQALGKPAAALLSTSALSMPAPLASLVGSIQGTRSAQGFHVMAERANLRLGEDPQPSAFNPLAFPKAYSVGDTPDGRNTTVGIIVAGELDAVFDDYETAQEDFPLPRIPMEIVRRGDEVDDEIGVAQWDIDSQVIQAMAGGYLANMIFYDAPSLSNTDITTAISDAVNDGRAKIINISLGQCEQTARDAGVVDGLDPILEAGVARGMVFSVAAGNTGATGCGDQQSYPASSRYVVAVGGTTLQTNSAGGHFRESAWSRTRGAPSTVIARPAYQDGVVNADGRGVPDLALDADPATGAAIIFDDDPMQYGGTGLSAALFTGLYARIESATNNSHGSPTPSLYTAIPANPGLVYDITEGRNARYSASKGWDFATGFGAPRIDALADYVTAHPDF